MKNILDQKIWRKNNLITGTILVGEEGLNGTIAGEQASLKLALKYIKSIHGFSLDSECLISRSKNPWILLIYFKASFKFA